MDAIVPTAEESGELVPVDDPFVERSPNDAQSVLSPASPAFDVQDGEAVETAVTPQGAIAPGMVLPDGSTVISVGTP